MISQIHRFYISYFYHIRHLYIKDMSAYFSQNLHLLSIYVKKQADIKGEKHLIPKSRCFRCLLINRITQKNEDQMQKRKIF